MKETMKQTAMVIPLILIVGIALLVLSVPVMLGLGVVHETTGWLPALSYWQTFWVLWGWRVMWTLALRSHDQEGRDSG